MSRRCELTGRGPRVGNMVSHSNRKTKRKFDVNLQKVRVLVDGRVVTMKVSTRAIKSGMVVKPPIKLRLRKPKVLKTQTVVQQIQHVEDSPSRFFSESSVVTRLFKPRPAAPVEVEEMEEFDGADSAEDLGASETENDTEAKPAE